MNAFQWLPNHFMENRTLPVVIDCVSNFILEVKLNKMMHELFVSDDVMENLPAKVHLSIHDTSDQIKEALLTMENITLVIDCVSNFILEV